MTISNGTLGPMARQFFAWAQMEKRDQVRTGDLVQAMALSKQQEASLLHSLSARGLILRLWRGLYLVPSQLPTKAGWSPSPCFIIAKYMEALRARFHISGYAMFNWHGFSDQISSWFTVYNNKASKTIYVLQYRIQFVKVRPKRIGSVHKKNKKATGLWDLYSSPEQVLFDAIHAHSNFGTLPKAYEWLIFSYQNKKIDIQRFVDLAVRQGNISSLKRIGWALEQAGAPIRSVQKIKNVLPERSSRVALSPKNRRGNLNKFWMVAENV